MPSCKKNLEVPAFYTNLSVPDSLICIGSRVRQIGAFRLLKTDCTRLRHRRMSWVVSKGRGVFSIINWSWNICQVTRTLAIQKIRIPNFTNFTIFLALRADCARLKCHRILSRRFDTLFKILFLKYFNLAVSRNPPSKSKNREICEIRFFFEMREYVWLDRCYSFNSW